MKLPPNSYPAGLPPLAPGGLPGQCVRLCVAARTPHLHTHVEVHKVAGAPPQSTSGLLVIAPG